MREWVRVGGLRWGSLFIYCLVLFIGTFLIVHRIPENPHGLVAARKLEANRLLQSGDLSPVSTNTQYLTRSVKANEVLMPGDISSFPSLSFKEGEWPLAMPLTRDLVTNGTVNAGASVRICKAGGVVLQSVPVRTVFCPSTTGECIAVIALTSPKPDDVVKAFGTGSQPYLQAMSSALPGSPPAQLDPPCK